MLTFIKNNLEALSWIAAIMILAGVDPSHSSFTLCPFNNLGFTWCPGCGIGHSISWLLHGKWHKSLEAHPLGIFGIIVIIARIIRLTGYPVFIGKKSSKTL